MAGQFRYITSLNQRQAEAVERKLRVLGVSRYTYLKTLILQDLEKEDDHDAAGPERAQ